MKKIFTILIAASLVSVSCSKIAQDSYPESEIHDGIREYIEVSMPQTKVGLGDEADGKFGMVWTRGDRIAVVDGAKKSVYELVEGENSGNGVFRFVSGDAHPEIIKEVVYPADGTKDIPEKQIYTSKSFDPKAAVLVYSNPDATSDSRIVLQSQSSFLCFQLTGTEKVTDVNVAVKGGNTYTLKVPSVQLSDIQTPFYVVIPALTDARVDVTFKSESGSMTRILASKTFSAGKMHRFAKLAYKSDKSLRLISYNIGMCSKHKNSSPKFIADVTKELNADAAVMNEVKSSLLNAQNDKIANALGWKQYYQEAERNMGNLICWNPSKFTKTTESFKTLENIKSEVAYNETRVCLFVEFEDFVLVGSHLETDDFADHTKMITDEVAKRYSNSQKPVLFCGDMNTRPYAPEMLEFEKNWRTLSRVDMATLYNAELPNSLICIDYIFLWKGGTDCRVTKTDVCKNVTCGNILEASDHFPVFVDLIIGNSSQPLLEDCGNLEGFDVTEENDWV